MSAPLYASEEEIAALVLGKGKVKEWRALAVVLERGGLPQADPMTGCRYLPAVRAFFDRRHGLTTVDAPPIVPDGSENWGWQDQSPRRAASGARGRTGA